MLQCIFLFLIVLLIFCVDTPCTVYDYQLAVDMARSDLQCSYDQIQSLQTVQESEIKTIYFKSSSDMESYIVELDNDDMVEANYTIINGAISVQRIVIKAHKPNDVCVILPLDNGYYYFFQDYYTRNYSSVQ